MQDNHTRQPIPVEEHPGDAPGTVHEIDTSIYARESNPRGFARVKESQDVTLPTSGS